MGNELEEGFFSFKTSKDERPCIYGTEKIRTISSVFCKILVVVVVTPSLNKEKSRGSRVPNI